MENTEQSGQKSTRLHYLDWLQVLAILGVFIFHSFSPFSALTEWHINNAEKSALVSFFNGFFALWGMPFFFLMAGTTSWFSLRRRTPGRYVSERVTRLLLPFIVGAIVLTPIQAYYELSHKGWWTEGSFVEFILSPEARTYFYTEFHPLTFDPAIFGRAGYHLWFVGFLFAFALIALPVFWWLKQEAGQRFVASLARLAEWRGGLLVFTIPLMLARWALQPGYSLEHNLPDFVFTLLFFVSGYILVADERFLQAIRRDRLIHLILGIAGTVFFFSAAAGVPVWEWIQTPSTPMFHVTWAAFSINSWCWSMFTMYIGMRYLDFANERLQYSREATYPFFWVHQPVIVLIAFYAVQWEVGLLLKLLVVVIGSFVISLGLYEVLVRRIGPVRALFGVRPKKKPVASPSPGEATT